MKRLHISKIREIPWGKHSELLKKNPKGYIRKLSGGVKNVTGNNQFVNGYVFRVSADCSKGIKFSNQQNEKSSSSMLYSKKESIDSIFGINDENNDEVYFIPIIVDNLEDDVNSYTSDYIYLMETENDDRAFKFPNLMPISFFINKTENDLMIIEIEFEEIEEKVMLCFCMSQTSSSVIKDEFNVFIHKLKSDVKIV